jgi:hypothetical protein
MRKRFLSFLVALSLMIVPFSSTASATEARASTTLSYYNITMKAGNRPGELRISYEVNAKKIADSVGISSIVLYSSTGAYITTVLGSEKNGLIETDALSAMSTYSHTAVPGNSYYAAITVFAEIGDDYDSRKIVTDTVTAPT